ncbi:MAG: HD-GYP domain-containing protein [Thermoleophilaceae bacterium]
MSQLLALSEALVRKDAHTAVHSRKVADLAERVGNRLGMFGQQLRALRWAALLHDVGKIEVRDEVLRKPGTLTPEEFDEIKAHAAAGAAMVERVPFFGRVHPLVRASHERWDGRGYPDGLSGEAIPLGARVICACDAFDAMISDRPYRRAMSLRAAMVELRAAAGSQFDPDVVEALVAEVSVAPLRDARIA